MVPTGLIEVSQSFLQLFRSFKSDGKLPVQHSFIEAKSETSIILEELAINGNRFVKLALIHLQNGQHVAALGIFGGP